jgi:hypothetical protein
MLRMASSSEKYVTFIQTFCFILINLKVLKSLRSSQLETIQYDTVVIYKDALLTIC